MRPIDPGQLIAASIPVLIGLCATFLGLGLIGKKPEANPTLAARLRRQRVVLCILGPGAIAFGLYTAFSRPMREVSWQRCATEDGVCSVEFPGKPQKEVETVRGTTHRALVLQDEQQNVVYRLIFTELSQAVGPETVEEQLDSMRDPWQRLSEESASAPHLVGEEKITQDGVPGRELRYTAPRDVVIWMRVFLEGKHSYRLLAAAPKGEQEAEIRRFLDSVRFKSEGK
jgi:hypothetical protein